MRFVLMIMATAWVTALAGISAVLAQTVAEREAAFKQAVLEYRDSTLSDPSKWLAPESPWAPFIGKQFSDGLGDAQKEEYLKAQDAMNCDRVLTLEVLGLYALHPGTGPAFEHAQVREAFEQHIAPNVSFGLRRCRALKAIEDHIQSQRRVYPFIEDELDVSPRLHPISPFDDHHLAQSKTEHDYLVARRELSRLAVCNDHRAAIRDHLTLTIHLDIALFHGSEVTYLAERARAHGMSANVIEKFLRVSIPNRSSTRAPLDHRDIEDALNTGQIDRARRGLAWFQRLCEVDGASAVSEMQPGANRN